MSLGNSEDLLPRLRAGDKSALKVLFDANYQMVCSTIHRFIRDHSLTEDLAQEVFVRFWEKRTQINITSSVDAYLRRMAVNEALGHLRRNKNRFEEEITPNLSGGAEEGVERQFLQDELETQVRDAINELPPRCRAVFKLSRFEDMTYQQIADQLGISVKTVENQMGKALKYLRERLHGYLQVLIAMIIFWLKG